MFTIYQVTNKNNGKSYVGFTTQTPSSKRWKGHQSEAKGGSKSYFHRAIRKYGISTFTWKIIEEGVDSTIGKTIREPYWISILKPEYNETLGGEGTIGWKPTKAWRQTRSVVMLGNKFALGARYTRSEKFRQARKGNNYALGIRWSFPVVTCPHCQKTGGSGAMKRYHFDNCKGTH